MLGVFCESSPSLLPSSLFSLSPESRLHMLQTGLTVLFLSEHHFEFQVSSESKSTKMVDLYLKKRLWQHLEIKSMHVQRVLGADENGVFLTFIFIIKINENKTTGQLQGGVCCMLWIIMRFWANKLHSKTDVKEQSPQYPIKERQWPLWLQVSFAHGKDRLVKCHLIEILIIYTMWH